MGKLSKSSSSSKRKRSKLSSKGNTKKSSKIKRSKSKKYRRRGGSFSYSDDDSLSSTSASSYSSDDSGRRGRSRLRPRKSEKSTKKSRHLSSSSSEDSTRPRKRKRSARTNDHKRRSSKFHVKKSSRKKAKRELSVSSGSSISCSSDSEYERRGRTHGSWVKDKMKSEIIKDEGRKSRYRSRSSSFSKHDQSGDECYPEPVSSYHASNRLRSVITVISEPEGREDGEMESDFQKEEMIYNDDEMESDFQKEEMIYNDDEYPSCKSNDSNDGGSRKEMTDPMNAESKMNRIKEDCQREESAELAGARNKLEGQCLTSELLAGTNEAVNKIDDLESILRQKALENLRKFRGGAQPNSKSCVEVKSTGDTECRMAESSQTKCVKDGDNERRMAESSQVKCVKDGDTECRMAESSQVKCVKDDCTSILNEVSFQQSQDHTNIPYQDNSIQESKSTEDNFLATNEMDNAHKGTVKKGIRPCNIKSRLVTSALNAAFSGFDPIPSVRSSSEQVHLSKTLGASDPVSGDATEQSGVPIDPPGGDSSSASASIGGIQEDKPAAEDPKSSKSQNEPQLEERTMEVMRGGELVQVSYKVYIPKKSPALARRQLRQ